MGGAEHVVDEQIVGLVVRVIAVVRRVVGGVVVVTLCGGRGRGGGGRLVSLRDKTCEE